MGNNGLLLLSAALALNTAAPAWAAQRVEHDKPTFAITIPSEFSPVEDKMTHLLAFVAPCSGGTLAISVMDLGGTIGLELLKRADLPPATPGVPQQTIEYLPLREIKVSVLVGTHHPQGVAIFTMGAQVPLRERGIQINVAGPADEEQEIRALLASVLGSFEGELVPPGTVARAGVAVRKLSMRERILVLGWSTPLVLGWVLLLLYAPLRLALIGRGDVLLSLRANWLAAVVICLIGGSALRLMLADNPTERAVSWTAGLVSVLIAYLVAKARARLVERRDLLAKEAAQAQAIAPTQQ